jgi:hypothetical protein
VDSWELQLIHEAQSGNWSFPDPEGKFYLVLVMTSGPRKPTFSGACIFIVDGGLIRVGSGATHHILLVVTHLTAPG